MSYCIVGEAAYYQPPDPPPECQHCYGSGKVEVFQYVTCSGEAITLNPKTPVEIDCPRCEGTGHEVDDEDRPHKRHH